MPCIICNSEEEIKKFSYLSANFFECTGCGLIRTLPFPTALQIEEHYRNKFASGNYNTLLSYMEKYRAVYKGYICQLKKKTGTLEGKRVLDIGCFTGDFLDLAKLEGALTYGIELQQDACNIACKKHGGRIQHCSFHEAVFDVQFDIITMFGVIEHLTHPEILIDMASMWLVEGGILIIETPNTGSFFAKLLQKYWPPYTPIEHIHYFSENNIRRLLEQYPLIRIETKRHFKKLSIDYVYGMLQTFGTEFHRMLSPLIKLTPDFLKSRRLPFYIGEMLVLAEKHSAKGSSY